MVDVWISVDSCTLVDDDVTVAGAFSAVVDWGPSVGCGSLAVVVPSVDSLTVDSLTVDDS